MGSLIRDLRYGLRTLAAAPTFTAVAVMTLALGIGANTAVFSVVNAVLLRPLPYEDSGSLLRLVDTQPPDQQIDVASYPEYLDWREQGSGFVDAAAFLNTTFSLTGIGEPEHLTGVRVSSNLLRVLGVSPALGRNVLPEEEVSGAGPVVLISHGLWQRKFGADAGVIGRSINLMGRPHTVIGVLPRGFDTRAAFGRDWDALLPLGLDTERAPRDLHFMTVIGRLSPGVSLEQASAGMQTVASRLRQERGIDHGIRLAPLLEGIVGATRPMLLMLLGSVGFVLLIACANVANLLMARAAGRRKEIAIRLALGAGRGRLLRQLLTESAVMGLLGGGLGLALAWWGLDLVIALGPADLPRFGEVGFDLTVFLFTLGVSLLAGFVFGLAPALQASSGDLQTPLREGGRGAGTGSGRQRLRGMLVVSEVALSLVLLVGAGLLVSSFMRVLAVDKGFDPQGVLAFEVDVPMAKYGEPQRYVEIVDLLLQKVRALSGVEAAAGACHVPLSGANTSGSFRIEGTSWPEGEGPSADLRVAGPDYFRVMRIPILRGRGFDDRDGEGRPAVAIINESLAKRYFPGQDPIGRRVDFLWNTHGWQEVVGVVGDIRHGALDQPVAPELYMPSRQNPVSAQWLGMTVLVRAAGAPDALLPAIRAQVRAADPDLALASIRTLDDILSSSVAHRRLSTSLLGSFAVLALILAAFGIYGVISYSVAQRMHEFGLRMALGAVPRDVLRLVIGRGMVLVGAGIALGLAGAVGLTRVLAGLLFGVSATDPATFAGVSLVLVIVSLLACWLPARRATRVDPVVALRYE